MLQLMHLPLDACESQDSPSDWICYGKWMKVEEAESLGVRRRLPTEMDWEQPWGGGGGWWGVGYGAQHGPVHSESRAPNVSRAHPSHGQQGGEGALPLCSPCQTPAAAASSSAAPARTTGPAPKLSLAPWFRHSAPIMFWRELKLQELPTGFAIPLLSNFSVCWLAQWSHLSTSHFSVSLWFIFISFPELFIFKREKQGRINVQGHVQSPTPAYE